MVTVKVLEKLNFGILLSIIIYGFFWLLVGASFSHPNAEDFSLTAAPKREGIVTSSVHLLATYDGRYFTNILHGINPMSFGYLGGYKPTIVFGVFFFTFSLFYFFQTVNRGVSWFKNLLLSAIFVVVHFALTPSLVHELYWMVSSFVYLYCWCFTLIWISSYIWYNKAKSLLSKNLYFLLTAITLVCSIGINEMMLFVNGFFLAIIGFYKVFKKNKDQLTNILLGILSVASYYMFLSSPGILSRFNSFDLEKAENHNQNIVLDSLSDFSTEIIFWLTQGGILLSFLIVSLIIINRDQLKQSLSIKTKPFLLVAFFVNLYLMTYAYYIPMGYEEFFPNRVYTTVWTGFQLFILFFFILNSFIVNVCNKLSQEKQQVLFTVALLYLFCAIYFSNNNINLLKREYNSGLLEGYDNEINHRYETLRYASSIDTCYKLAILSPLKHKPMSVFFPPEIEPHRVTPYWNQAYEYFFDLSEVRIDGDTLIKKDIIMKLFYE